VGKKKPQGGIDELALMVGRRFDELQRDVTGRFDVLELRLDVLDRRLDDVDQRLDRIEFNTSAQERRISTLEDRVRQLAVKSGLTFN
jgi:chaperonin cofactor prefoldin